MKKLNLFFITLFIIANSYGQKTKKDTIRIENDNKFNYKSLIIPSSLIGFGVIGLGSDGIKKLNSTIQNKVYHENQNKITIDDYMQYLPFASVYGLNAIGIIGKNSFKDRTLIIGTAYLIMGTTIIGTKALTAVERPDGSRNNSFPSGHTATAFMGAEFLYQEYKDVSIWYGISGYAIAAGTGYLRMYNNKHWFTDVMAGAGVGILSTKIAYWINPWVKQNIFKNKTKINTTAVPFYNGEEAGFNLVMSF